MCFKNLPIEFDSDGKAKLLETSGDPYGVSDTPIKAYVSRSASHKDAPTDGASNGGSAASTQPPRMSGWATN